MKKSTRKVAYLLAFVSAGFSALHFYRIRSAGGVILAVPKIVAGALAPFLIIAGLVGAALSLLARTPLALAASVFGVGASARYLWRVVTAAGDFSQAFGSGWYDRISPLQASRMLQGRWTWRPARPPEPRWKRDVPLYTIAGRGGPGSERSLIADIWQPPAGVAPSGLAFIYFHGSGWHFLDKDVGTRPMFRHLAAQGHVIMDVAYRMCPETEWWGMLADVKHAIAWMKANASRYGVDPAHIVLGGGSAGAHLALLAAYTPQCDNLTPVALKDADLSVRGVVSWYGPTDMNVYYRYAGRLLSSIVGEGEETPAAQLQQRLMAMLGFDMSPPAHWQPGLTVQDAMMRALLGGRPDEVPDVYRRASPVTYAAPGCPPTLLLQGEHDSFVSAEAVRALAAKLREAGVPVVHVEYPQTEHAFDIVLPRLSPAAQAALYETERFLALLATEPVTAAPRHYSGSLRRDSLELQLGQEDFARG